MVLERYSRGYYTCIRFFQTEMDVKSKNFEDKYKPKGVTQRTRRKEGNPAKRAGGGVTKKGDVGDRKRRDRDGKGGGHHGVFSRISQRIVYVFLS